MVAKMFVPGVTNTDDSLVRQKISVDCYYTYSSLEESPAAWQLMRSAGARPLDFQFW